MFQKNFTVWPPNYPKDVPLTEHTVYHNLERSVAQCADSHAVVFYESCVTYRELYDQVCRLAGWMSHQAGIKKGDRVGIFSQNCPQYVIAYYAALRIGAVVVPINPMYVAEELDFIVENSGLKLLCAAQELHQAFLPQLAKYKINVVGIQYRDYITAQTALVIPDFITEQTPASELVDEVGFTSWQHALNSGFTCPEETTGLDELVMLPYTSGSTGNPKGCRHSNISVQHGLVSVYDWFKIEKGDVFLAVAPMFHVVGLQAGLNSAIAKGGTLVILPRWDRKVAAHAIHNFRVTVWPTVPTMVMDLINLPEFESYDVSSLRVMFGGGSSMPEAVADKLYALSGVTFMEGYGMTETCCPATANPPQAPRKGCAGIPVFNTSIRIVDHETLALQPEGEIGEILIHGPQVMQGYWQDDNANAESFVELDGQRYLRTGDLGYVDECGYIYIVDRIKRMINASGYKVWPTQIEAVLHKHPEVEEVCVISTNDPRRGETVKALIVKRPSQEPFDPNSIIDWSRQHLAAYKIPRVIELVNSLPKSASGKVLWRELQDQEHKRPPVQA